MLRKLVTPATTSAISSARTGARFFSAAGGAASGEVKKYTLAQVLEKANPEQKDKISDMMGMLYRTSIMKFELEVRAKELDKKLSQNPKDSEAVDELIDIEEKIETIDVIGILRCDALKSLCKTIMNDAAKLEPVAAKKM